MTSVETVGMAPFSILPCFRHTNIVSSSEFLRNVETCWHLPHDVDGKKRRAHTKLVDCKHAAQIP